jgi:RpiB/LacA/LacB family sugar-phosphate isomerase
MIYLASDHGGFELKNHIKQSFDTVGIAYEDVGAHELDPNDDYPDYAKLAASKISQNPTDNKAILICRSGVGEVIVANKFNNVRASLSWNEEHAKKSREDDDTNVLTLPADYISKEEALNIVGTWLNTDFSNEERHTRRINKIKEIENKQ